MNGLSLLNLFWLICLWYFFDLDENHYNYSAIVIGVIGMPLLNFICLNSFLDKFIIYTPFSVLVEDDGKSIALLNLIVCIMSAVIFFQTLNDGIKNTEEINLVIFFNTIICLITLCRITYQNLKETE